MLRSRMDTWTDALRGAGLRATRGRRTVLEALVRRAAPLTHAELAADTGPLDPVTLYRILDSLERAALVHRVFGVDGVWRFCPQPDRSRGCPGNHVHFLCSRCGAMTCLDDQPLPRVTPPVGATIARRQFVVTGLCAACGA